jgi:hypothetical protein
MIEEVYPEAVGHLRAAIGAKRAVAASWSEFLDTDPLWTEVLQTSRRGGRISVGVTIPEDIGASLDADFAICIGELWAALNALVQETVGLLSDAKTSHELRASRSFAAAETEEEFKTLLATGCMDGVLRRHFQIVRDIQPWHAELGIEEPDELRDSLRRLIAWRTAVAQGASLGAWATPDRPQVVAQPPARVSKVVKHPRSEATASGTAVATFQLRRSPERAALTGAAGSFIDLGLRGANEDAETTTLEERLTSAIGGVSRLIAHFADGLRAFAMHESLSMPNTGPVWTAALDTDRGWEPQHLRAMRSAASGVGVIVDPDDPELTVVVATASGVFESRVRGPLPLEQTETVGVGAEKAARDAVSMWGLPDFIMRPVVERKGSGVREISDGIIVAGKRGVILQVKGRNAEAVDPDKESRWVRKNAEAARRQIDGTFRRLREPAVMTNGRGRTLTIDGTQVEWVGVIIIEHPHPPRALVVEPTAGKIPVRVLLRRDWEFLFGQLKSTRSVVDYLFRVEDSAPLGEEPVRYFELAVLDERAEPGPRRPHQVGQRHHIPTLPTAPTGHLDAEAFHVVRRICEEIAAIEDAGITEEERIEALADIDGLPVGYREELGRILLDELKRAVEDPPDGLRWRARTFSALEPGGVQVGFAVCSTFDDRIRRGFHAWLQLRHHERGELENLENARSVGVMVTPRLDGFRAWDTTIAVVAGDLDLSDDDVTAFKNLWGGRNDSGSIS